MDEADRVAHRIAIIDHGRIVAQGSSAELKAQTENRLARGGVPRPDRIDDSRRARGCRRSDAPDGEDVEGTVSAIYILWLRELKRYSRSRAQVVASLGPAAALSARARLRTRDRCFRRREGQLPAVRRAGVIGCRSLFTSIFSGIGLLWDRQFGFLKETLVAPVPRLQIMVGRTLGGASVAMIQGCSCSSSAHRRLPAGALSTLPLAILFMALIAIVFAGLGTAIGSTLQNMQGFQLIMNFLVMPIFFPVGRAVSAQQHPDGAVGRHQARSADLRCGRPSRRVHRHLAFRHDDGRRCAVRRRLDLLRARRLVVFEDSG
jgi:ABC-2 type transport system permease protein